MAKKITIENLAGMMQKGFEGVQGQIEDVQQRMVTKEELHETREVLAQAIKDLEMRFSAYFSFNKEEIDRLKSWMEGIEARISSLETNKSQRKK